ncbi:TolC family protein [Parabacteroides pacaensis]|uniref:TolC family protein n=1 Tax=Parabacteroides pacaensis TaxID=2086575 RepID=UPI000D0E9015|nr:TolC family protein [Parabacteroides pacaensis]
MRQFLILIFALVPFIGEAQEYSLEQYLERVKQENVNIKKAQNETRQSEEDVKMARSEYLPSISANLGYRRDFNASYMYVNGEQEGMEGLPAKFPVNFKNTLNGAVTLEQSIYNAPALANRKIAKLANAYANLLQEDQTNEMLKQGTLLFYQLLYAKESLSILEENSALAQNQYRQMSEMFTNGLVSEFSMKQSELYYQQTLPDIENARKSVTNLMRELRLLANIAEEESFEITGRIEVPEDTSIKDNNEILLDNTLKMEQSLRRMDMAKQEITLSKAAFMPKISLELGYTLDTYDDKFRFKDRNGVGHGSVNLSIPIFSGGYNRSKVRKSRIAYEKSKLEHQDLRNQLEREYQSLLTDKKVALTQIITNRKMVELANAEIQASEEKLSLGLITNLELRETRISYIQAKLQLLNAALDYQTAIVNIKNLLK